MHENDTTAAEFLYSPLDVRNCPSRPSSPRTGGFVVWSVYAKYMNEVFPYLGRSLVKHP